MTVLDMHACDPNCAASFNVLAELALGRPCSARRAGSDDLVAARVLRGDLPLDLVDATGVAVSFHAWTETVRRPSIELDRSRPSPDRRCAPREHRHRTVTPAGRGSTWLRRTPCVVRA